MTSCEYIDTHEFVVNKTASSSEPEHTNQVEDDQFPDRFVIEDGQECQFLPNSNGCPGFPLIFNAILNSSPPWLKESIEKAGPATELIKKVSIWISEETIRLANEAERAIDYVISETTSADTFPARHSEAPISANGVRKSSEQIYPHHPHNPSRLSNATTHSRPIEGVAQFESTIPEWRKLVRTTAKAIIHKGFKALGVGNQSAPPNNNVQDIYDSYTYDDEEPIEESDLQRNSPFFIQQYSDE